MKIIAVLDCAIGAGGGFDQAINALLQIKRLTDGTHDFEVLTTEKENLKLLNKFDIPAKAFRYRLLDRVLEFFSESPIFRKIQTKFKLMFSLERQLILNGCGLVYFVTPNRMGGAFQQLNYITTLWDLCHRDNPEFPEVRKFNEFYFRELNFKNSLPPAYLILTDSVELADLASKTYGINRTRFLPMPYSPSFLATSETTENSLLVLSTYSLAPGYFIYPAQFWPHKNHIRILQALVILRDNYAWQPCVVFLGRDNGNLPNMKRFIKQNNLSEQVKITGFVPAQHIASLYRESLAVVMPTYFGPTNLPPLEAWAFDKPLIYSAHLKAQVDDAATLVDPDCAEDLAHAMYSMQDALRRSELIEAGARQLVKVSQLRKEAEASLVDSLRRFSARQHCWE